MAEGRRSLWRRALRSMRLTLLAFAAVTGIAICGAVMVRFTLLKNAFNTGTAMSRSYAAEAWDNLTVYETLLTFGASSLDWQVEQGADEDTLEQWLQLYFRRVETVLGTGVVDPYVVLDGRIIAANPWEGDASYDVEGASWYLLAVANPGQAVFTDVYVDAISNRPVITLAQYCTGCGAVFAFDILPRRITFDTNGLEEGDSLYLCDGSGALIFKQSALNLTTDQVNDYLSRLIEGIRTGKLGEYNSYVSDQDGRRRAVYYTKMDNGWYAIVTIPYRNILGNLWWFLTLFALAILMCLGTLVWMTWRDLVLSSRVERAGETVRALGNTYYALYRVNVRRETYETIKRPEYAQQLPQSGPYEELLTVIGGVMQPEVVADFTENFSCANIRELVRRRVRDFGGDFLRRFGEEYRWVNVRVLFDESLPPEEAVLSFREVDREKRRQLQERKLLEDSLKLARRNEQSKQAFFSAMSHDMRTPLNAILGMTELSKRYLEDPPALSSCLEKIQSSGKYLLELINDILDMSRMEQGKLTLDNRQFNLRDCVEECLGNFRLQAQQEGKTLECSFQAGDTLLMGDDFRVRQILNNLLSNAVKFTPKGGRIQLTVEQIQDGERSQYRFVVEDTGIGMSPEFQKRLFEPYAREMRFSAQEAAGTGLGMAITKSLVSQMEGEIQVESTPGKGSKFTVMLPFAVLGEPEKPASSSQVPFTLQGLRILLAEDNELNREIAAEMLDSLGVTVTQAVDGQEAVERFQESSEGSFDAILMDMQMPNLDGCGAARAIRALDRADAKTVPIVAVTANAFSEDVAATATAGMNAHVTKPIDYGQLEQLLRKLCSGSHESKIN
jgi:signal transduction histidine kinase